MSYVSTPCAIGTHNQCSQGQARPGDPQTGVVFQTCVCGCHHPAGPHAHQEGAAPCSSSPTNAS